MDNGHVHLAYAQPLGQQADEPLIGLPINGRCRQPHSHDLALYNDLVLRSPRLHPYAQSCHYCRMLARGPPRHFKKTAGHEWLHKRAKWRRGLLPVLRASFPFTYVYIRVCKDLGR